MRLRYGKLNLALCAPLAAALATAGCAQHRAVDAEDVKPTVTDPDLLEVANPQQFPVVEPITRQEPVMLAVNGVVAPDVSRTVRINAMAGGRVVDVRARLGDDVKKGQVLMLVRSADLEQAIAAYQRDQADGRLARLSLARAQDLYAHGALAQQDLQNAENAAEKAAVSVRTDADQLRLLGGDLQSLSPVIEVRSPIAGAVVDQQTADGEAVKSLDSSQSLFMVADLSRVWVLADVYENDLSKVALGDRAEVRLNAYPDLALPGTVGNISAVLDPGPRTAKVRVELANVDGLLRPQMFATVKFISRKTYPRLLLPATALLMLRDKDWVFLRAGDHSFRRTEVRVGAANADGMQEILGGLKPGDQVVSNALQFSSAVAGE